VISDQSSKGQVICRCAIDRTIHNSPITIHDDRV
jgi:hypothetical protein